MTVINVEIARLLHDSMRTSLLIGPPYVRSCPPRDFATIIVHVSCTFLKRYVFWRQLLATEPVQLSPNVFNLSHFQSGRIEIVHVVADRSHLRSRTIVVSSATNSCLQSSSNGTLYFRSRISSILCLRMFRAVRVKSYKS